MMEVIIPLLRQTDYYVEHSQSFPVCKYETTAHLCEIQRGKSYYSVEEFLVDV